MKLLFIIVFLAIGILAYFGLRQSKTKSGKVTTPSPSSKRDGDNKTKKDVEL